MAQHKNHGQRQNRQNSQGKQAIPFDPRDPSFGQPVKMEKGIVFKVIFLGGNKVGKSSVIMRYIRKSFNH